MRIKTQILTTLALLWGGLSVATAQSTVFTYQGRLTEGGEPANGLYDFRCQIYDKAGPPGDSPVSGTITSSAVPVTNGLFTLNLDFGAGIFTGADRWLFIQVRTNNASAFQALSPRQQVTPTPYAIASGNLTGTLPAGQLSGTMNSAALPTGGNWHLTSTLTMQTDTLAIDPLNKRVGVGTANPSWPLDIVDVHAVARLDTIANIYGSVLELRNISAGPAYLGAINFNDNAGSYPGQIGYTSGDALTFRTDGAEHMRLDGSGRLDVTGSGSSVSLNTVDTVGIFDFTRAVKATSDGLFGTAVFASSSSGTALLASSANGTAGSFSGPVRVDMDSAITRPQLQLRESQDGDYARLQFQVASRPYWHIAVGGGAANQMNFYNSTNGDVMTLAQDGTLYVKVLTITGGADIAEPFRMSDKHLPKGAVVVIDEEHPGQLKLSSEPYDTRVAGVVSGANGVNPGLALHQQGVMEGDAHVALTGRVYVQADAGFGAIKPGDMLTTSSTPGHAMKARDRARSQGAILGKAMTRLSEGKGLVLVLVSLQ